VTSSYRPPEHPRREPSFPRLSTAELGLNIALASFGVLFLATLIGFVITRVESPTWRTADMPDLPPGLGLSTLWLVALFITFRRAERALSHNALEGFRFWMHATGGLGLLFLLTQGVNWFSLLSGTPSEHLRNLYVYSFLFLTGLHALHVVGGAVPLAVLLWRADGYSSSRSEGVRLTRRYWDFLLAMWVVLLSALLLF
jgi:cytochrome c oxidase subunit III